MSSHEQSGGVELEAPEPTKERVFGRYETVEIPISECIRLPQVRSNMNPKLPELVESIRANGLLNPIDVALMTHEQLSDHIDFVNEVWDTKVSIDDYPALDVYPVVIAGNTRAEAVSIIATQDGADHKIVAKVHQIDSPEEFLALSIEENIHKELSQEQRAVAIVNSYEYGRRCDKWSTPAEYQKLYQDKFSPQILREALYFADLPQGVRDFVFSGELSYSAGVELGKNASTIMAFAIHGAGEGVSEDDLKKSYHHEIAIVINRLFKERESTKKRGVKHSVDFINRSVKKMEETLGLAKRKDENQMFIQDFLAAPDKQYEAYKRSLEARYKKSLAQIMSGPTNDVIKHLQLESELTGESHWNEITELERNRPEAKIGLTAIGTTTKLF